MLRLVVVLCVKGRKKITRLNMASMSLCGMARPSFLMKRKPCVEAASKTCLATPGEGLEMSMTGISEADIFDVWMLDKRGCRCGVWVNRTEAQGKD